MPRTRKVLTARQKRLLERKPYVPTAFPTVINPHIFNPSTFPGDRSCLECGRDFSHKLHIHPHTFNLNYGSKRGSCMCGLSSGHVIHGGAS